MKESIYLIFAIIPAVLWIFYFYTHDKGEKEPLKLLFYSAFFGALVVIPVAFLELFIIKNLIPYFFPQFKIAPISAYTNFSSFLLISLLIISIIEEIFKFLAVRLTIYNSKYFNEIADGIIYMVAAAFGFAAFENFLYFLNFGNELIFVRSLFTPLFHASASSIVGHYLGLLKWDSKKFGWHIYLALFFAIILHFFYNFLVFFAGFSDNFLFILLAVLVLVFSAKWMFDKFKKSEEIDKICCIE